MIRCGPEMIASLSKDLTPPPATLPSYPDPSVYATTMIRADDSTPSESDERRRFQEHQQQIQSTKRSLLLLRSGKSNGDAEAMADEAN